MKKTLLAAIMASMAFTSGSATAKTDLPELSKELEIMTNIMHTALRQDNSRRGIRYRSIDVTYLQAQGVVFEVHTNGGGGGWHFDFGDMIPDLVSPPDPVAPISVTSGDNQVFISIDEHEIEELAREATEVAQEALREAQRQLRNLREQEREYAWEEREYERRKRDLEFEKRNADKERRAELDERAKELEKEMKKIESKKSEVNRYARQIEEEQQQQREKRDEAKKAQYTRFMANFESNVGDVLCKYGAGIKALPMDENVSFILPKLGSDKKDRIYVFSQKDIQSCVRDKINPEQLLSKANTYMF